MLKPASMEAIRIRSFSLQKMKSRLNKTSECTTQKAIFSFHSIIWMNIKVRSRVKVQIYKRATSLSLNLLILVVDTNQMKTYSFLTNKEKKKRVWIWIRKALNLSLQLNWDRHIIVDKAIWSNLCSAEIVREICLKTQAEHLCNQSWTSSLKCQTIESQAKFIQHTYCLH